MLANQECKFLKGIIFGGNQHYKLLHFGKSIFLERTYENELSLLANRGSQNVLRMIQESLAVWQGNGHIQLSHTVLFFHFWSIVYFSTITFSISIGSFVFFTFALTGNSPAWINRVKFSNPTRISLTEDGMIRITFKGMIFHTMPSSLRPVKSHPKLFLLMTTIRLSRDMHITRILWIMENLKCYPRNEKVNYYFQWSLNLLTLTMFN